MDTDHQTEEAWILSVQRKLYQWSKANPDDAWRDLWGWLTDLRMLRHSWRRVASNKAPFCRDRRDDRGAHPERVGEACFLEGLRLELRSGAYRPSPSRRKLIPKAGKPGSSDRSAYPRLKTASFKARSKYSWSRSSRRSFGMSPTGFRPGRSTHGALEHIRMSLLPHKRDQDGRRSRLPYSWIIEGDIKGCFDNLSHHHLLTRLRTRVADKKAVRLVGQFLTAV